MDANVNQLLTIAAAVTAISVGYGKVFGKYQFRLVEWLTTALATPGRYKGVLNLLVGLTIATGYSAFAAWQVGDLQLLALGCLAGVFASVEAADVHDLAGPEPPKEGPIDETKQPPSGEVEPEKPDIAPTEPLPLAA